MHFSHFQRLEVKDHCASMVGSWRILISVADWQLLTMSSHGRKDKVSLSDFWHKGIGLAMKVLPSWSIQHLKILPPNAISLGIRFWTWAFCMDIHYIVLGEAELLWPIPPTPWLWIMSWELCVPVSFQEVSFLKVLMKEFPTCSAFRKEIFFSRIKCDILPF